MPKVSILVPIYNVEKYLAECLDSIINQTLNDIEIICINDGSTDNSSKILEEYRNKDSRIKVINKENSGYGASMNMGLQAATGEYIGIVESDDFAKNTMFEDLYNQAKKYDLDIIKSDFYYYLTKNRQARHSGFVKRQNTNKVMTVKDDLNILKTMPSIWSAIYRKAFLDENNIKFVESPGASYQDTSFAFKALSTAEKIMFTNKAYLYYRCDNENSSVASKAKVYCICDEWDEITRYLNEHPEIKAVVNEMKLSTQFNAYKWNVCRMDSSFRNEFIDRYQATFRDFYDKNELQKNFYKRVRRNELKMLLDDKPAYRKYIDKLAAKKENKQNRRKMFSVRINSSRISIILFGKQILEIG